MDEYNLQRIQQYLRSKEVQERIQRNIQRSRIEATVTIGRAAQLFGFSESKLRELESLGLLNPLRKENKGQRQYTLNELDKLAIIRELLDAKYTAAEIPPDIEELWSNVHERDVSSPLSGFALPSSPAPSSEPPEILPINVRIEEARSLLFWRFFASHSLRLALLLISEYLPNNLPLGLILSLAHPTPALTLSSIQQLPQLGTSLLGWLSKSRSSHTLLTFSPFFQYSSDYTLLPLVPLHEETPLEPASDNTFLILERLDRRSHALSLPSLVVSLLRRLLAPLYTQAALLVHSFGPTMNDLLLPATDLTNSANYHDLLLTGLADLLIELGGSTERDTPRWRFCLLLLPDTSLHPLPLQQQVLIARAQSQRSPYIQGQSFFSPQKLQTSLSIRAFQSGRIIYKPEVVANDRTFVYREIEGEIRSNIAVPIGSETGHPLAVLYVASDEPQAFSLEDQRLLRLFARLIENVLRTSQAHLQMGSELRSLMRTPSVVDSFFGEFLSENEFLHDLEALLARLASAHDPCQAPEDASEPIPEVISFIGLDLDEQESLASQYGDQIMRNLTRTLGHRIQELLAPLITKSFNCQLYYMHANRFYLILRDFSLEDAREKAERLRVSLDGSIAIKQTDLADNILILPHITVHLAVTSYTQAKLRAFLTEYASLTEISTMLSQTLDVVLKLGTDEGGNTVVAWNPRLGSYFPWQPQQEQIEQ
ncbi:MerR family transcriptional regulator [Ktedonosporobacter rubrisoli]|nr:MerR family transcriptional regulator [Ktedonosporobacter rubrisoli]